MTPAELSTAVRAAVQAAVDAGDLAVSVPDAVKVERPKVKEHGDYATSVALQLAKPAGRPPREVAEAVAVQLRQADGVVAVDVAGPGFLNITLDSAAQGELARTVVDAGQSYGSSQVSAGHRFNLEFVSANPTGPLHLGHVRWAAVGDALARILQLTGAEVTPRVLLQRRRRADRPLRRLAARGRDGQADSRGRVRRRVHRRDRRPPSSRPTRRSSTCQTTRRPPSSGATAWR